jgi:YVTN family beta-propeller protein
VLEFRILGPLEVVEGDRPVALGGPRQRALLAILLLHRGEAVSSDRLIDQLWGDHPPATAAKTLQGYVSHLRKALGPELLVTRAGGYTIVLAPGQVDVERFEELIADAHRARAAGDVGRASELLATALGLWRGDALADLAYEPFAHTEVARLEEARLMVLEARIDADLTLGHHRELVGELDALVASHPHRERVLAQLMLALYRSGRQAEALEAYRRGRRSLDDELGLEPGPELRALEQRILSHDPALELPTQARSPRLTANRKTARRGRALIAAGFVLLLAAAIAAGLVELTSRGATAVRVAPNSVAAIDTRTDRVVAGVPVGARPSAIAFGSGSLWVANLDDQTISRVDPQTLQTLRTIALSDPPMGIATARGRVWVVQSNPTQDFVTVASVDPQFDVIDHTVRVGNVVPDSPGAIAARGDALWVAPSSGELTRLDPGTGQIVQQVDPNAGPAGIGLGAGTVWATDSEADNVIRLDPTGLLTTVPVGHSPGGIAVGDGGVWVADSLDDTIVRIDPDTSAVTATIRVGNAPAGVSVGAGSVWVANSGDGTVTRINPNSDKVIATIAVGGSPQAITFAGGRAWVTIDARTIPPPGVAAGDGTARVDFRVDVGSMDPALAYSTLSWQLLYATCAKLLNYPDKSGPAGSRLVPEVAQSLPVISADGKTYTFTIREGFRFSPPSNAPVTAQTFKDSIERSLSPRMKSPVAYEFSDIVGARAYMAGKTPHISGVIARGNTLAIKLVTPEPDLPARTTEPAFCAVPPNTPIDPNGVRLIPSAGPYRVASYTPGEGVVLTRNPNYHGSRPHRLARIEVAVGIPGPRAVADVLAGTADYANNGEIAGAADADTLAARYGPGSPAARSGRQQYFVGPEPALDFLALNTHHPTFADARLRRAVSYAIDRAALARLGDGLLALPDRPTDDFLPPGVPGHTDVHVYPLTQDLIKARTLARGHAGTTVVLYTCNASPCGEQAQIIKTDLAAIGLRVEVKAFPTGTLFTKLATRGEPFDIGWAEFAPDYLDPDAMLNTLLEEGTVIPTFDDPAYRARLATAARLTGTRRYLTYARLDADLVRNAAPLIAFGNNSYHDLFSKRMGCQTYVPAYGIDLAALCIKRTAHRS